MVRVSKFLLNAGSIFFVAFAVCTQASAAPTFAVTDSLTADANYNLTGLAIKNTTTATPITLLDSLTDIRIGGRLQLGNAAARPERAIVGQAMTPPTSQAAAELLTKDGSVITGYQDHSGVSTHRILFDSSVPITTNPEVVLLFPNSSGGGQIQIQPYDSTGALIAGQAINYTLGTSGGNAFSIPTPTGNNAHFFYDMAGTDAGSNWALTASAGTNPNSQALLRSIVLNFDGTTDIAGIQISQVSNANFILFEAYGVGVTAVPEPGSLALCGLGLTAGIVCWRRRKSQSAAASI